MLLGVMNSALTFQAYKSLLKFRLLQTAVHLEYPLLTQEFQLFVKKKEKQNDKQQHFAKNCKQATAYRSRGAPARGIGPPPV